MRTLFLGLAAALSLTACITDDAETVADGAIAGDADTTDGGVLPDEGGAPDAGADAGRACGAENPATPVCLVDADCGEGATCIEDPLAGCMPSACSCDEITGDWVCTEDCGPVFICAPASGCDTPDPSALLCIDDADCGANEACEPAPGECRPSSCFCDPATGGWTCTDDCGPANRCTPRTACEGPNPAEGFCAADADCAEGDHCVIDPDGCAPSACSCDADSGDWVCTADCGPAGQCLPVAIACADDFECVDGFCEAGVCRQVCFGDGLPAACDAIPPVCAIGQTSVTQGGCYSCVDARTCDAPSPDACGGAWFDEMGACHGPNDGLLPAECCLPGGQARTYGLAKPDCAPHDGPATRIELGDGSLQCQEAPPTSIQVLVWGEVPLNEVLSYPQNQTFNGYIQYCPTVNVCMSPANARLLMFSAPDHPFAGRLELTLEDGAVVRTTFTAEDCPRGQGGLCG